MIMPTLHSGIIESCEDVMRRYFVGRSVSKFTEREKLVEYETSRHYSRNVYLSAITLNDRGYIEYFDIINER